MMNTANVAALLRDDFVTVTVRHAESEKANQYTYRCLNELADTLEIGSRVVVFCNRGYQVAKVTQIDEEAMIDVDAAHSYNWVIQAVDVKQKEKLEEQDQMLIEMVKSKKRMSARTQLMAAFGITDQDTKKLLESSSDE